MKFLQSMRLFGLILYFLILTSVTTLAQQKGSAFFADGFHGGVYGHYPIGYTQFIISQLEKYPDWKINLEIEPETWDSVKNEDEITYRKFQQLVRQDTAFHRIEFVNPAYAQPYCYNISGESLIRQFQYGIDKLKTHFPDIQFNTYSSEEPCFTSCLPALLKSMGCRYAVLKNPDTGWGGYVRGMGGSFIIWEGSDGSQIPTVPRYSCEYLKPGSTWQTMAWTLSREFLDTCAAHHISFPAGMCYQDAGWRKGPWLQSQNGWSGNYQYICWNDYFKMNYPSGKWPVQHLTQEDFQVSLVWGAQVLQKIAQEVRVTENLLVQSEKIACLQYLLGLTPYPNAQLKEAWRTLMLSQHHDCWIVPYNLQHGISWAERVSRWTSATNAICKNIQFPGDSVLTRETGKFIVFNTLPYPVEQLVTLSLKGSYPGKSCLVKDRDGNKYPVQQGENHHLIFKARIPAMGFRTFTLQSGKFPAKSALEAHWLKDGCLELNSDIYQLVIDPAHGGSILHIRRKDGQGDFVSQKGFNTLNGYLPQTHQWIRTGEQAVKVQILENGPLRVKIALEGVFARQKFRQQIILEEGQDLIRCDLAIFWQNPPLIGAFEEDQNFRSESLLKAFYNDQYKLHLTFPLSFQHPEYYRDAPFDVYKSGLENSCFNRWDSIRNTVVLHWTDAWQASEGRGLAILTDHTTSCQWGQEESLGLTVQYIGKGLWGRFYGVDTITRMSYALYPHQGSWNQSGLVSRNDIFNEPWVVIPDMGLYPDSFSLIHIQNPDISLTSMTMEGSDLLIRLYNGSGMKGKQVVSLHLKGEEVYLENLAGKVETRLPWEMRPDGGMDVSLSMPEFGISTLRISHAQLLNFKEKK